MKVLHIVHSLRPGGMENGVVNLAKQLVPSGVRTDVCCIDATGEFAARLPEGSQVHVLGKAEGFRLSAVSKLKQLLRREQPDVIHTHGLGPLTYAALARLTGARFPLLHGEHGSLQPPDLTQRRLRMRKWLYRCCDAIHTVSHGLTDELEQRGLASKPIQTIVNGVDTVRFHPAENPAAARLTAGLPADAQVAGIVGRFIVFKRHDMLLEAFEQIAETLPKLHLVIVGSRGETEEQIYAQARASRFADRIHFTGFTTEPELYYRAMDILAMPSEKEGMSNALLESMACAVPALCSGACGNAEILKHEEDGLLLDLPDANALAQHMVNYLKQPELLNQLGSNARETVLKRYSMEAMGNNYLSLYQELIGSRG